MTKEIPKKPFLFLLTLLLLSHFVGLFNDVFTADSAVYATISKSFVTSGDYINIYLIGDDWLDKPHFPFWICAFFMKIFGLTAFAYKLPSFLFFCMGLYYTFLLAKKLYDKADRVLIDAPCSGLGVLRRNPDAKWKLQPDFIDKIKTTQQDILQQYSRMVKNGGQLVYATCSVLPSENQEQVKTFLASEAGTNFELLKDKKILSHKSGFDGFYMALLERKA